MSDARAAVNVTDDINLSEPVYLRQDVTIEPLVCRWWAWPHLLSPVQVAFNIAFRYLPLLQSFVSKPRVHISASKDPRLFGGPFVHLSLDDVPKVEALIEDTKRQLKRLLAMSKDLKEFDIFLQDKTRGFSLNEVYASIPQSLSGLIELMYDINGRAKIHLLEELLQTEFEEELRRACQGLSLSIKNDSTRAFFMSTPVLESEDALTIPIPFSSRELDDLVSMRYEPLPLTELAGKLPQMQMNVLARSLFTQEPPERNSPIYVGDEVRVRYFGHACVLIQTKSTSVLIDPTFAVASDRSNGSCPRFTLVDLPDMIDYVVLTHCHQDHYCPEMLLQIRHRVRKVIIPLNNRGCIADPSMRLSLRELGFSEVLSLSHFDEIGLADGRLISLPFPGEHADLDIYSKQSIFLEMRGRRLLFLVDSDGRDVALYGRIAQKVLNESTATVDALFLGMECHGAPLTWLYGPLLSRPIARADDESRRLSGSNCERGLKIIRQFNCKRVYVYAMGQEPWMRYLMGLEYGPESIQLVESSQLVDRCRSEGMLSERLYGSQDIFV